ncbi:histidine ABC transporter substrate-binding protein HisJ [Erwinia sp. OLTSP20]|uniref:lysine/arginine/ornithine ABC transporter substrate-binding protein ArgT n=1 Tax=unclassified Erwinia TaxID=2622719 RepID=UPI000C1792FF|nr:MULTISPECIES: lysine/arginine/ornithine ABC transporter substrate-binding protein ArgT [unclassified Erwinia]PIJ51500.1 histidine ABC transporter substrate-binding protein HisJ [Erwinia sp. OAMSP11]PIJ68608.1 histidine ABC transporter substrate-binding protein HisJ [Erwinia sp. OLSSP12]PIJ83411.1 histidine ABC transporter substrate-binding protein HisJ [Erwinia sp. OLCASP19]PIJ86244.1 histidine ABC transporter substrate-binding protein HisJ [Erwinia sp. OLMTSP26]PIJ88513.1 histidine ABC tra
MKKQLLALSLLLAVASVGNALAAVPKTLRIGTDPTYAPFESKNAQGQLVGFDIDLANEICKRIEAKCTFVESDFDALIPSLKAKKIDAIISSLSITAKRQEEIAFSDKLYAANARLIAPKGSSIQPTLASLKGKNIGLLQGTTQETYANQYWRPQGVTITPYANQDLVYQDLTAGRIDAAFQDEVAASEGFLKQPMGKAYAFAGPAVKDDKIFGVGTGMGLPKESTDLKAAIDKAFAAMRKDGTYDKLAKKYFDFNVYGE